MSQNCQCSSSFPNLQLFVDWLWHWIFLTSWKRNGGPDGKIPESALAELEHKHLKLNSSSHHPHVLNKSVIHFNGYKIRKKLIKSTWQLERFYCKIAKQAIFFTTKTWNYENDGKLIEGTHAWALKQDVLSALDAFLGTKNIFENSIVYNVTCVDSTNCIKRIEWVKIV